MSDLTRVLLSASEHRIPVTVEASSGDVDGYVVAVTTHNVTIRSRTTAAKTTVYITKIFRVSRNGRPLWSRDDSKSGAA